MLVCFLLLLLLLKTTNHHGQIRLLLGDPADVARVDLLTDHVDKLTAGEREVIVIITIIMIWSWLWWHHDDGHNDGSCRQKFEFTNL